MRQGNTKRQKGSREVTSMDDPEFKMRFVLWETFARTGNIMDYLNYVNAVKREESAKNWDQNRIP